MNARKARCALKISYVIEKLRGQLPDMNGTAVSHSLIITPMRAVQSQEHIFRYLTR